MGEREEEREPGPPMPWNSRRAGTPRSWARMPCTFIWPRLADGDTGQSCQLASWPRTPGGWHLGRLHGLPARLPQACSWQ